MYYLGLAEADENCKRFVDRALPECFKKVCVAYNCILYKSANVLLKMACSDWLHYSLYILLYMKGVSSLALNILLSNWRGNQWFLKVAVKKIFK